MVAKFLDHSKRELRQQRRRRQRERRCISELKQRTISELKRRTSTGSGFFSFLDSGFAHFLGQLVSIIVKTLRNTNLGASRCFKMKKTSLPVDVRRSKTLLLKLPISKTITLHVHHSFSTFFSHRCTTATWNFLISPARFTELVNGTRKVSFSLSKLRYGPFGFNLENFANIWQSEWNWMRSMKFETARIFGLLSSNHGNVTKRLLSNGSPWMELR